MSRYDREDGPIALALGLGAAAESLLVAGVAAATSTGLAGSPIGAATLTALILGPFLCSFVLTILLPRATNWSLASGWPVLPLVFGTVPTLVRPHPDWPLMGSMLAVCMVGWLTGLLGVLAARRFGPSRSRSKRPQGPPVEPQCPRCGYVLYFAQKQTCPECGRRFRLREVDTRLAQWDGYVLRPMENERVASPME